MQRYRLQKFDNGNSRWYLKLSVLSQNQRFCWYLYQEKICMYIWGFMVHQHLRSLAPIMNEYWWLWWPNNIRGPGGPKAPWHLSYRWGKTIKKPHPGNLSWPGIEPRPAAWQACMLLPAPQRWTPRKRNAHYWNGPNNFHILKKLIVFNSLLRSALVSLRLLQ